jgi:hypothetical protein
MGAGDRGKPYRGEVSILLKIMFLCHVIPCILVDATNVLEQPAAYINCFTMKQVRKRLGYLVKGHGDP